MASAPSVSALTSSADAFKYPLPTVRQLHRQLATSLDEKNARLRTLVGGSYRQLLGTAETIVDMRRDIEIVERRLERVADGCGRGVVGKKVRGLDKLGSQSSTSVGADTDLGWLARMKVLDGCAVVVRKLLRGKQSGALDQEGGNGQNLVTAAKILVFSRLLLKTMTESTGTGVAGVDELRKKIGSLRRRLSVVIERRLQRVQDNRDELAEALCAYSLSASAGAKDVLRHFLHIRGEAMALQFEDDEPSSGKHSDGKSIVKALGIYINTLLDVQALVPRKLSDFLLRLKADALLQDKRIRDTELLRLDIGEKWFGDEITHFTPYIRHDDLEGVAAVEMLKGWAKKASEVLLQGLKTVLGKVSEFKSVLELRTNVLEMWIQEGSKAKGFDSSVILDELREAFNDRMVSLIEARIAKLHLVGTEVEATLASWTSQNGIQTSSLWDSQFLDMDLNNGGSRFKTAIVSEVHGRNDAILRVVNSFGTWRQLVDELYDSINQLRKQRWDDDLENLDDDLSLEDRNEMLSKDDPAMLQKKVERSLKQAFYNLHDKFSTLSATYRESQHNGTISVFLLRIIREIRLEIPPATEVLSFGMSLVPELQRTLASTVSSEPLVTFQNSLSKRGTVAGKALWEGTPQLPVQPSPLIFRFLRNITSAMSSAGSDLWSPTAVSILKVHLRDGVVPVWQIALDSLNSTEPKTGSVNQNGGTKPLQGPEASGGITLDVEEDSAGQVANGDRVETVGSGGWAKEDVLIQWIFDIQVLRQCVDSAPGSSSGNGLASFVETMKQESGLAVESYTRVQQSSQDYWKRTCLLFGLLN